MKENMGDVANRVQAMEKYLTYNVLDSIFFSGKLLMPFCSPLPIIMRSFKGK